MTYTYIINFICIIEGTIFEWSEYLTLDFIINSKESLKKTEECLITLMKESQSRRKSYLPLHYFKEQSICDRLYYNDFKITIKDFKLISTYNELVESKFSNMEL